ncbi:DMT family transporter [Candidatus Sumerlaeota bacterium]|nr:DMT family transporter [Candidatus Sumerlaeota bacterium]
MSNQFDPKTNGPFIMFLANLFFGMVPLGVRMASLEHVPSAETTFVRFVVACVGVAVIVAFGWGKLETANWPALIWRGIFGGFAVLLYFYALHETTAGKGTLLNYMHSLWANLALVIFYGHKPPKGFWLLQAMAGVGLWLVLNPDIGQVNRGDLMGLISGWFGAGAIITVKELRRTDNALTIFTGFSVVGLLFALAPGFFPIFSGGNLFEGWITPTPYAWLVLLGTGIVAMAGQMLFTHGYAYTSIPFGTLMSLSVPALAALGGWAFLHEPLTPHFILGGTLIMIPCAILGILEGRVAIQETPPIDGSV